MLLTALAIKRRDWQQRSQSSAGGDGTGATEGAEEVDGAPDVEGILEVDGLLDGAVEGRRDG